MKTIISAACIAASLSFCLASCNWFRSNNKTGNPLVGTWKLDSLATGGDSSIVYSFLLEAMHDTSGFELRFTRDTLFSTSENHTDTSTYRYNEKENQLIIQDSTEQPYTYKRFSDSLISLTGRDSSIFFLKKQ